MTAGARPLRWWCAALLFARVEAKGGGIWIDPAHYVGDHSYAGMRYITEDPPHTLYLVGTDDGDTWFALKGYCTGPDMTHIHFDFSSKGGPKDLTGEWSSYEDRRAVITWPDGNVWMMRGHRGDPDASHERAYNVLVRSPVETTPSTAMIAADDHLGAFVDKSLATGPESFAGRYFIAEDPPHVITVVGSDDGSAMFAYHGICIGEDMDILVLNLSTARVKGPSKYIGRWIASSGPQSPGLIEWADGKVWTRVYKPAMNGGGVVPLAPPGGASQDAGSLVIVLGIMVFLLSGFFAIQQCKGRSRDLL